MKKRIIITMGFMLLLMLIFLLLKTPVAQSLNEKGLIQYNANNLMPAEKLFSNSLFWKKNFPEARINLIKTQIALDKLSEVKTNIRKLMELSPLNPDAYALEGQLFTKDKNYVQALKSLDRAIELDSSLAYAYHYRGIAKGNTGDLDGAAEDYLKAQELDQSNLEALQLGTVALSKMEDFDIAIDMYNKLIERDQSNVEAFFQRGRFKMKIGDHAGAVQDFNQTVVLQEDYAEAYYNRGKSFGFLEQYNNAIEDFTKASELNFKISAANYNAGLASLQLNKPIQAKNYLENSVKKNGNSDHAANCYNLLGVIETMQESYRKSIPLFNKSIQTDSTLVDAFYNRAIAYGYLKEHKKAIDDINTCIRMGKKSSDMYFVRAVQKISMSDFEEGCKDLTIAIEMGNSKAKTMKSEYCKNYE